MTATASTGDKLPEAFITANSGNGKYWVEIKCKTMHEMHAWHAVVLGAYSASKAPGQEPYAWEYAKSNGDETWSVHIARLIDPPSVHEGFNPKPLYLAAPPTATAQTTGELVPLMERLRARTRAVYDSVERVWDDVEDQDASDAAAAIERLTVRVRELEDENFALAANQCEGPMTGDEHGHFSCAKAQKRTAERDDARAEASELSADICELNGNLQSSERKVAVLAAALEPFAEAADGLLESEPDGDIWEHHTALDIKRSDLIRARAALEGQQ